MKTKWFNRETGEIVIGWWGKLIATLENKICYGMRFNENKWEKY